MEYVLSKAIAEKWGVTVRACQIMCVQGKIKGAKRLDGGLTAMTDIPQYIDFIKVELVEKGWSNDKKYYIETKNDEKLLLRVSDISEYDKKKAEFDAVKMISNLSIPISLQVDFGTCDNGKSVYSLLTWVDGEDADFKKDGSNPGVSAVMVYYPDSHISLVILSNQNCNVWEMHRRIDEQFELSK